jgi:hypothetical protein
LSDPFGHELDRNDATETRVASSVHFAHAAAGHAIEKFVRAKPGA